MRKEIEIEISIKSCCYFIMWPLEKFSSMHNVRVCVIHIIPFESYSKYLEAFNTFISHLCFSKTARSPI